MRTATSVSLVIVALVSVGGCDTDVTRPLENPNPPGMAMGMEMGPEYEIEATDAMTWTSTYFDYSKPSHPLIISVGSTVRWTSRSHVAHSVIPAGHAEFEGAALQPSASGLSMFEHTFQHRGTFTYYCGEHPGMEGTVVVVNQYGG